MKDVFNKIGGFTRNHFVMVIVLAFVLLVLSMAGASQMEMETGIETFISSDDATYQDFDRLNQDFGSDVIIVMIEGDLNQILSPSNVKAMELIEDRLNGNEKVLSASSPAIMLKQALSRNGNETAIPDNTQDILNVFIDPDTSTIKQQYKQILPDENHALIMIVLAGVLPPDDQKEIVRQTEAAVEEANFENLEVVVTGDPAVSAMMEDLLGDTRNLMLGMAVVLLFVILPLIFKVRGLFAWRWLPLGVVLVAMIYMAGIMGITDISLTMMTMSVFPILIGLGIDYGIQFHNRYDEEASKGKRFGESMIEAVTHIGPAVGIALVAGCLGFAALLFSPIPMIQDFGLTLIVGVICAYVVAIFPMMAILYWHDRRNNKPGQATTRKDPNNEKTEGVGFIERILRRISPWVIRHPFILVPLAIAVAIGGVIVDSEIETVTDDSTFISQDIPVIKSFRTLEEVAGGVMAFNVLVESDDVTDPQTLNWMTDLESQILEEYPDEVSGVESVAKLVKNNNDDKIPSNAQEVKDILETVAPQIRGNLINADYTASNFLITIVPMEDDPLEDLKNRLNLTVTGQPEDTSAVLTGFPVIRLKLVHAVTGGRNEMTAIGIFFIFGALLLLFRFRILRAIMATLPIVMIIGWAGLFMYIFGIAFTPATATFGALIMGIGVEFTILLMMRYYEEREKGEIPGEAMSTAMAKIGRAVSVSAFTTIGGFAALLIARDFPILIDFGIVTMTNVFFALAASLLVLPSIIVWVDSRVQGNRAERFL